MSYSPDLRGETCPPPPLGPPCQILSEVTILPEIWIFPASSVLSEVFSSLLCFSFPIISIFLTVLHFLKYFKNTAFLKTMFQFSCWMEKGCKNYFCQQRVHLSRIIKVTPGAFLGLCLSNSWLECEARVCHWWLLTGLSVSSGISSVTQFYWNLEDTFPSWKQLKVC